MPRRPAALLGLAALLALGMACGTETGNPDGELDFAYNARTRDAARVGFGEGRVAVDAVWLRLEDLVVVQGRGPDETEHVFDGLGFADHSGAEAAVQTHRLPDAPTCRVQTRLGPGSAGPGEPESVAGASVGITGALQDGRPFVVRLDERIPLRADIDEAGLPDTGAWLLTFDVNAWLDPAELEALDDPEITIDGTHHPELQAAIAGRLEEGIALHLDLDDDGTVDDGEPRLD